MTNPLAARSFGPGHWDFRITDEDAVLAARRAAYLRTWPDDTQEDAEIRVQQVAGAAAELEHAEGLTGLNNVAGLQLQRDVVGFIVHEGEDDETFDPDPFGTPETRRPKPGLALSPRTGPPRAGEHLRPPGSRIRLANIARRSAEVGSCDPVGMPFGPLDQLNAVAVGVCEP